MDIPLMILLSAGPVGAIDVLYFHLWKFRLYERPESVKEEITHLMRGFLVPVISGILLFGHPEGNWFWFVAALFAFDTLNSLLDVVFEPSSRAPRIVPRTELAIHFTGISAMGAAWAVYMFVGWNTRLGATALRPHGEGHLPALMLGLGYLALIGAFALVIFEATLFARALLKRRSVTLANSSPA